jgi:hypothetical protein
MPLYNTSIGHPGFQWASRDWTGFVAGLLDTHDSRLEAPANEKATRQLGRPFLSRENSSNGSQKSIRTFWRNLMSRKSEVSSKISDLNSLVFNNLRDMAKSRQTRPKTGFSSIP